jgi:hypothetical protein
MAFRVGNSLGAKRRRLMKLISPGPSRPGDPYRRPSNSPGCGPDCAAEARRGTTGPYISLLIGLHTRSDSSGRHLITDKASHKQARVCFMYTRTGSPTLSKSRWLKVPRLSWAGLALLSDPSSDDKSEGLFCLCSALATVLFLRTLRIVSLGGKPGIYKNSWHFRPGRLERPSHTFSRKSNYFPQSWRAPFSLKNTGGGGKKAFFSTAEFLSPLFNADPPALR